jgi:hypothetical protein
MATALDAAGGRAWLAAELGAIDRVHVAMSAQRNFRSKKLRSGCAVTTRRGVPCAAIAFACCFRFDDSLLHVRSDFTHAGSTIGAA